MNTPLREQSLILSAPMVNAIRRGTKTQMRRLINPQPRFKDSYFYDATYPRGIEASLFASSCPISPGDRWCVHEPTSVLAGYHAELKLEITQVDVQRLHDITDQELYDEGMSLEMLPLPKRSSSNALAIKPLAAEGYRAPFSSLWDTLHSDHAPWESNPWVWVLNFKRIGDSS